VTGNQTIWAIAAMVIAGIAGIVALAAVGDTQAATLLPLLIGFLAPTITGMIAADKADKSATVLTRIDGRLNGELDGRIADAVKTALREYHAPSGD